MQPSPLSLQHYYLLVIDVKPEEGFQVEPGVYADFNQVLFESKLQLGLRPDEKDNNDFSVTLHLKGVPKESGSFPYHFNIGVQGFFSLQPEFEIDSKMDFVLVNGAAILYGVLRDALLTLTSRFEYGSIMVPTVNFLNLKGSINKKDDE